MSTPMKPRDKQLMYYGGKLPASQLWPTRTFHKLFLQVLCVSALIMLIACAGDNTRTTAPPETSKIPAATEDERPVENITKKADDTAENSYYYYLEAYIRLSRGELDEAVFYLKKAIGGDPGSYLLKRELALVLLRQKKEREALAVIEKLIESDPLSLIHI